MDSLQRLGRLALAMTTIGIPCDCSLNERQIIFPLLRMEAVCTTIRSVSCAAKYANASLPVATDSTRKPFFLKLGRNGGPSARFPSIQSIFALIQTCLLIFPLHSPPVRESHYTCNLKIWK